MTLDWLALGTGVIFAVGAIGCAAAAARSRLPVPIRVLLAVLAFPLAAYAFNGLSIGFGLSGH